MPRRPGMLALSLAGVLALASGCSRAPWGGGEWGTEGTSPAATTPGGAFTVEVWHNAPVAGALTIYLRGPSGAPLRLGRVSPSGTEVFEAPGRLGSGEYRLMAETTDRRWIQSLPFSPFESNGVRWDVDRNRLSLVWESS